MKPKLLIVLWFILVWACAQNADAQNSTWKPVIDSLNKQLTASARADTNRAFILADLSFRNFDIDTVKGRAYAMEALDLSQKLKWQPGIGDAWCGLALNSVSDLSKMNAYVLKSIDISQRCNNRAGLKWAYCTLAWFYLRKNDIQNSLKYYTMALKLNAPKAKDVNANINDGLGYVSLNLHDTTKAIEYFKHSLALFKEQKIKPYTANTQIALANIYFAKSQMAEARNYFQQGYAVFFELGDKADYSDAIWNIAATYLPTDMDKALGYYNQVIKIKEELHDDESLGRIYAILGDYYYGKATEKTLKYYQLAQAAYQQAGDKADAANMDWSIGLLYYGTDAGKALGYFQRALKVKEELNDYASAAQVAAKISSLYSGKEYTEKAIECYKLVLGYYLKLNDKANYSNALWSLGTLYKDVDADKSVSYYKQAAEIKQALHDYVNACNLMQNIGLYYLNQKDYTNALDYFQQELKLGSTLHDHTLITNCLASISAIFLERDGANKMIDYYTQLLADKKSDDAERADILYSFGTAYLGQNNYPKALGYFLGALQIAEKQKEQPNMGRILDQIGNIYWQQKDIGKALDYLNRSYKIYSANNQTPDVVNVMITIANCYGDAKDYDKAVAEYLAAAQRLGPLEKATMGVILNNIANTYKNAGNYEKAADYITRSIKIARTTNNDDYELGVDLSTLAEINIAIAKDKTKPIPNDTIFPKDRKALLEKAIMYIDQGINYIKKSRNLPSLIAFLDDRTQADELLGNYAAAYADHKKYILYRDSVFNQSKNQEITRRELQYQYGKQEDSLKYEQAITGGLLKQQTLLATQKEQQLALLGKQKDLELLNTQKTQAELLAEQNRRKANEQQLKASQKEKALVQTSLELQNIELKSKKAQSYYFMAGIAALLLISVFIGRNYYNQRVSNRRLSDANALIITANKELAERQEEITAQRDQISNTLSELKNTQRQLIQSEKMASLGELTAGIAHEIQNPLNFVNNFSEVSVELLEELTEEAKAGHSEDVIAIAGDLTQNLQKIQHHGKRADFIVKGMLEHSRTNTGEKQLTDMNVLCDEFLKLSYHGLRAKDKNFNAEMITHFDPKLPKVNVSQQDMGRVMLNLFNNAFYAVNQKLKAGGTDYKPEVGVTTLSENGQVVIKVKDNGIGIPDIIKDKIMQPFFTTKPTGEGTGLGLSLTYDMVVKGHGGKIDVDTKEREFTEFVVTLPLS